MNKFISSLVALVSLSGLPFLEIAGAQSLEDLDKGLQISSIKPEYLESPKIDGFKGKVSQRRTKWLAVEANFSWQQSQKSEDPRAGFLVELDAEFFVLLDTRVSREEQRVLLKGSTTLAHVGESRNLFAVMFVSPRTLDWLFISKVPAAAGSAVAALGVVLKRDGKIVALYSDQRNDPFWEKLDPSTKVIEGLLLPKSKTPFAFSSWDYFEEEKASD